MNTEELQRLSNQESISGDELEWLLSARSSGEVDFKLIDTREKYESMSKSIAGTDALLPTSSFYPKIKTLKDKEQIYILYCSGGDRSALHRKNMRALGYKKVVDLRDGIDGYGGATIKNG
ncbi:MAG: rhodanese-like domain-containing protein [Helicobacteraceae bacterium]|jgi:rhodanese-related sulfurtransferase|nr:rhodanese-like domain-containing protein [Helicobacteraceae bacterium]